MRRYVPRGPLAPVAVAVPAALAAPVALCALLLPWRDRIPNLDPALLLVVVVVGVAALGSRVAGALAAVGAAGWFDFFFTRPYQQFAIGRPGDLTVAGVLLAVGLTVSQLAARARRLSLRADADAGHLDRIHRTAALSRAPGSALTVVDHVRDELVDLLGLTECRFEYGSLLGRLPRLERDGSIVLAGRTWDAERLGWPAGAVELRLTGNGRYLGRYLLEPVPGSRSSRQARLVAVTLAEQAGAALDAMHQPVRAA
ncbi:histidine kinase [Streptomyces tateyamensis]|uniref:Histidine kinase n=1 Tax=Streptomyces tateyamensis TaxID=565073 RepID=A0A2V4NC83_9ACTN|nr:DUF4118 domain-containing protein [Streptomyces tateyamensis]PYC77697.1 histidine kinase [Streptomyces tateyamensis]